MNMGGIGESLMKKMGWKEGEGLGAEKSGPLAALTVGRKRNNQGVGAKRKKTEVPWWDKMMADAYGKPKDSEAEGEDILDACEGRRCRPHGSAKLARIAAQEDGKGKEETKRRKKKKGDDKTGKEVELRGVEKKIKKSKKKSKNRLGKKNKENEQVV